MSNNTEQYPKCCDNKSTRKICYDGGFQSNFTLLVCDEHYKKPDFQLFILKENKLD